MLLLLIELLLPSMALLVQICEVNSVPPNLCPQLVYPPTVQNTTHSSTLWPLALCKSYKDHLFLRKQKMTALQFSGTMSIYFLQYPIVT